MKTLHWHNQTACAHKVQPQAIVCYFSHKLLVISNKIANFAIIAKVVSHNGDAKTITNQKTGK